MSLRERQSAFMRAVGLLIGWVYANGYELTGGHALRCEDCPIGTKNSKHKERLAIDLNLFRDGVWLTKTEDHAPPGEYWVSLGGTWGGKWDDGNHYEWP